MAARGDLYSRLVSWLKIILPLLALAILSTLFLVSRTIDPSQTLPYADVDVASLAKDQRIGNPNFTGMTKDGAAISFRAITAHPKDGNTDYLIAEEPEAQIDLPTGRSIRIMADHGKVDQQGGQASLDGNAVVETSDGYRVETVSATARLDATEMSTGGEVRGHGPMGSIVAGKMSLTQEPGTDGQYVLLFENGVKLIYEPEE